VVKDLVFVKNVPGLVTVTEVTAPGGDAVVVDGSPIDVEITYLDSTKETVKGLIGEYKPGKRIARVKVLDNSKVFTLRVVKYE
jgi:hypothetical protein